MNSLMFGGILGDCGPLLKYYSVSLSWAKGQILEGRRLSAERLSVGKIIGSDVAYV